MSWRMPISPFFVSLLVILIAVAFVAEPAWSQGNRRNASGHSKPEPEREPEVTDLPDVRFTVQRVDLDGMAAAFNASSLVCDVWDRELNGLGRLGYEDGSYEFVLLMYTAEGYLPFVLGNPVDGIFWLDESDPDFGLESEPKIEPMRLTDDGVIVWRVWDRFDREIEWEGEIVSFRPLRTEFVATPIEVDGDGGFYFGNSVRFKNFPAHGAWIQEGINRRGDLTYWSSESYDLEELEMFEELALLWRADSNSLAYTESFFDVRLPVGLLNNKLHAANRGSTMQRFFRHYDIANDKLTEIGKISLSAALMSESGIVTANNSDVTRGAIWDPFTNELIDFPLDIGDGRNTRFLPIDIQDLPGSQGVIGVQIFGRVFNSAYNDLDGAPVYYEAGKAGFIKDLVVGNSEDTAWFLSLDPPRTRASGGDGGISLDGSRIVFKAEAWEYDSVKRPVVSDSSLVILHRVQEGEGDDDGDTSELFADVSLVDFGRRGRHMNVIASVVDAAGEAVSGALVEVAVEHLPSGQVSFESGTTDANGSVSWRYRRSNASDFRAEVLSVRHSDYD